MTNFPNLDFPISSADCADIEAIFIELMRARDFAVPAEAVNAEPPILDPYGNPMDLRS
jgi:hypothetical protein